MFFSLRELKKKEALRAMLFVFSKISKNVHFIAFDI